MCRRSRRRRSSRTSRCSTFRPPRKAYRAEGMGRRRSRTGRGPCRTCRSRGGRSPCPSTPRLQGDRASPTGCRYRAKIRTAPSSSRCRLRTSQQRSCRLNRRTCRRCTPTSSNRRRARTTCRRRGSRGCTLPRATLRPDRIGRCSTRCGQRRSRLHHRRSPRSDRPCLRSAPSNSRTRSHSGGYPRGRWVPGRRRGGWCLLERRRRELQRLPGSWRRRGRRGTRWRRALQGAGCPRGRTRR